MDVKIALLPKIENCIWKAFAWLATPYLDPPATSALSQLFVRNWMDSHIQISSHRFLLNIEFWLDWGILCMTSCLNFVVYSFPTIWFDFCHCFLTIISSILPLTSWCPHTPQCVTWFVKSYDWHIFWENNRCMSMTFKISVSGICVCVWAALIMCETTAALPEKKRLLPNHW